jgi:PTS system fructose-specific IIC component
VFRVGKDKARGERKKKEGVLMAEKKKFEIQKPVMTGISYMIPMVVAGGILGALAKGFGGYTIGSLYDTTGWATPFSGMEPFTWQGFWWGVNMLGTYAMNFAVAVLTAGIAYAIAERPGIVPGFIIGYTSAMSKAGFLGGLLMGFVIGYFVLWMKTWKLPKWAVGLMPVFIIPVISTLVCGGVFLCFIVRPLASVMTAFEGWIVSLNGGSKAVIGAVIGACMGFDMGGVVNKTASMAANGLGADGVYGPMSAKIIGGMTPPCGVFIASLIAKKKFSQAERDTAITAFPMGLCFITEGVLPFAAADPLHFIPASMVGSGIAGAIAVGMGVESVAGHGGVFVFPMMTNPLWAVIALVVGSLVTGVIYAIIKKKPEEEEGAEEEIVDLDIDF